MGFVCVVVFIGIYTHVCLCVLVRVWFVCVGVCLMRCVGLFVHCFVCVCVCVCMCVVCLSLVLCSHVLCVLRVCP